MTIPECVIVFLIFLIAILGGIEIYVVASSIAQHPTEAEAQANRERLAQVPVQTKGIKPLDYPLPVEAPEVKPLPVKTYHFSFDFSLRIKEVTP